MKNILIVISLFISLTLFSQEKGITPLNPKSEIANPKSTFAVVVGISDYQDEGIPDLRFADKDAEAFANFLRSPAGGSLDGNHLMLLTNEKATTAQFSAALDWLIEQCKEGDRAIIYFSGHGDVETSTIMNWGFLLTYSTPPTNYIAGAFPIYYLQSVIATLSQKNVKVVMISDACHAGKLAGSEFGGTQATALNLSKQFSNEVKIMSCQPEEFSMEGEQWGGGRGAFSFNLIEGLMGMADKNNDGTVKLLEIENYLEEVVPRETAPQSQIPMAIGSKASMIAIVDAASLNALKQQKSTEMPTLAKVETKGFEETVLEKVDTNVQEMYAAFLAAVEHGELLEATGGGRSANDLYEQLIQEESLASLHGFMKRNLAAALHDKVQVALNLYLKADNEELNRRNRLDSIYFKYPQLLSRAAELLGEQHYMYQNLRAKEYYFEGLLLRLQRGQVSFTGDWVANNPEKKKLNDEAMKLQKKALEYEPNAAFVYHEIALLNHNLGNLDIALENYQKAISINPNSGVTYFMLGQFYEQVGNNKAAIESFQKSVEINSSFQTSLLRLTLAYKSQHRYSDARILLERIAELDSNNIGALQSLGNLYETFSEYDKVEKLQRKITSMSNSKWDSLQLARVLYYNDKSLEALPIFEKWIDSSNMVVYDWQLAFYGLANIDVGNYEKGIAKFEEALEVISKSFPAAYELIGQGYLKMKRYDEAKGYFEQAFQIALTRDKRYNGNDFHELVSSCANEGETALALQWLETILKEGYDDYERLQHDRALEVVRKTQKFKDMMREYFPEKFKN